MDGGGVGCRGLRGLKLFIYSVAFTVDGRVDIRLLVDAGFETIVGCDPLLIPALQSPSPCYLHGRCWR